MPQTYIFPLDNMTNVEFTEEDLKEITKNYQLYLKNNPCFMDTKKGLLCVMRPLTK